MSSYWTLTKIDLYKILCPPKIKSYNNKYGKSLSKEQIIYSENQNDQKVYLVSNGRVKIVKYDAAGNEIIRQILVKGELFGEEILLNENKRGEYAIAHSNKTTVCSLDINTMRNLMRDNERFETRIYKFIGIKLKKIERRLDLLVGKNAEERIISYIYDVYKEQNDPVIPNRLSHGDIGKLLATSRETVSKIFTKLKKDGIIDYDRSEIKILDPSKLKTLTRD